MEDNRGNLAIFSKNIDSVLWERQRKAEKKLAYKKKLDDNKELRKCILDILPEERSRSKGLLPREITKRIITEVKYYKIKNMIWISRKNKLVPYNDKVLKSLIGKAVRQQLDGLKDGKHPQVRSWGGYYRKLKPIA